MIRLTRRASPGLLLTAAIGLLASGCGEEPTGPDLESRILGSWEWVSATGGIAGVVITPESEGFTRQLVLSAPGTAQLLRDGVLEITSDYEFVPAQDLVDEFVGPKLVYEETLFGFAEQGVGFDLQDRLVLIDPCCDGFVYLWERIE
ncbi:MAG: hypothetical protein ABFS14_05740 [Gemmatimonadota bacterium]